VAFEAVARFVAFAPAVGGFLDRPVGSADLLVAALGVPVFVERALLAAGFVAGFVAGFIVAAFVAPVLGAPAWLGAGLAAAVDEVVVGFRFCLL
jgi:hypothetical protein